MRGIRTTEFWLSLVALLMVNVGAVMTDQSQFKIIMITIGNTLIALGYTAARARAKRPPDITVNNEVEKKP